jgi:hypothetical protein
LNLKKAVIKVEKIKSAKRGRPELLTDDIKRALMSYRQKYPDWSAQRIIDKIYRDYFALWKAKSPQLNDDEINAKIRLPGKDSVLGYFRENKPNEEKQSCLDLPWHLGVMAKKPQYNILAEAIPYILMVQNWAENNPNIFNSKHEPLSIRQALWVSRLYGITSPDALKKNNDIKMVRSIGQYLYQWSEAYATREKLCELSNTPFDTTKLDRLIITRGIPVTSGKTTLINYPGSSVFEIDTIDNELIAKMEKDGE